MFTLAATIIASGGGDANEDKRQEMRRMLVAETGRRNPRLVYIPTDGGESLEFWAYLNTNFSALGCTCKRLFLLRDKPRLEERKRLLEEADLIYVGGGNTLRMMRMWRRFGVDELLRKVAQRRVVLTGVSAGAICWFEYGHSDSRSFSGKPDWPYIRVAGLGLVPGTFCPHVLGENRMENFKAMMAQRGGVGYGVNDGSAIRVKNGMAEAIGGGEVWRVEGHQGEALVSKVQGRFAMMGL